MNRKSGCLISLVALFLSAAQSAQPKSDQHGRVLVHPAATAAEQLRQSAHLARAVARSTDPQERLRAYVEAMVNLGVVAKMWPKDRDAIIQAGIMQADLAAELGHPK